MLTQEAMREREWGSYPVLRQAIENKEIPWTYYGSSSISDNIFDALPRQTKIAILVKEYGEHIKEIAADNGGDGMAQDLDRLAAELEDRSRYLKNLADNATILGETIRRDLWERDKQRQQQAEKRRMQDKDQGQ